MNNIMRSIGGFIQEREKESKDLSSILGKLLGQTTDLSGGRQMQQQQQQPMVQDALFRTPPGSDQTPLPTQDLLFRTPPNSDQTPFAPQLLQANALAQTATQPQTAVPVAPPEAVDAATAPLMAPRAAAPENAKSTIESILAGLGVDSEEAAKKAKNMSQGEMWMALGKGIGQIGKGQAVDIDSIVQMRRQRLDKSATELQDVARRRAAASLVYEQSGDASMASAVGQGAISYSDFTTERQRKEVNARANAALVRQAKQDGYMAKIVEGMDSLPESEKAAVTEAIANGVPFESALKPFQLDEAAKLAAQEQAKRDQLTDERDATMDLYTRSSDPYENQIAKAMRADRTLTFEAATEIVRKSRESAGGGEGISAQQAAENLAAARAVVALESASPEAVAAANTVIDLNGFADPTKTQALLKSAVPPAAPVDTTAVTPAMRQANLLAADVTLNSPTSTPEAIAVAQAVVAAEGGVSMDDALKTVQAAQTPAAATTTDITNYNAYAADEIANQRTPLSRLEYEQAAKPTTSTNINVNTTDGEELPAAWAKAEQTLAQKGQAFKRIRNAAGQLEVYIGPEGLPEIITIPGGEISQTTAASAQEAVLQAQNAFANNGVSTSAIDQVVDSVLQPGVIRENTTVLSGITTRLGEVFNFPTDRSTLLTQVGVLNAQKTFETLEDLNAQGIKLTPVSNVDLTLAGQSRTTLAAAEKLTDEALREEVVRQYNLTMDVMGGPASNRRFDSKGVAYKPSVDTLGYSEEGFERNWKQLPERLRTQWLSGEITSFPEDGAFAAVGADMNQRVALYEAYNGDIENRAKVGASFDSAKFADELGLTVQEAQNLSFDEYEAFSDEDKALVDKIHDRFAR